MTFLFQAPSKDAVSKTCHEAFLYSGRRNIPESVLSQVAELFEVDQKGARKVVSDSIWMRLPFSKKLFCLLAGFACPVLV